MLLSYVCKGSKYFWYMQAFLQVFFRKKQNFFWVCKMLTRRLVGTARNFENKPVFFTCNGVQIRRRVSYKAGTKEDGRTARNSRNASRAWKKITEGSTTSGGRVWWSMESGGEGWCSIQSVQRRRGTGKGYREGARLRPWGDIGGKRGRSRGGRQARRAKKFGVSEWCGCSSSRVRIYSSYI